MKKVKYLAMLLAAGMFAACSDNLEDAGAGNAGGTTPSTTEGYVRVAINMPTTSGNSSRSTDNEETGANVSLEDGEANEYNVENAKLVFFKDDKSGTSKTEPPTNPDQNAEFVKAYPLTKTDLTVSGSTETPQVTEQVSVIQEAPKVASSEQLYVLVILNYDSDLISSKDGGLTIKDGTKETTLTAATATVAGSKLSALQTKLSGTNVDLSAFIGSSSNQFTMTNAPLSSAAGNSGSIANAKAYTLVPVTVYDTEADALSHPGSSVYVERIVAKVSLSSSSFDANKKKEVTILGANGSRTKTGDIVEFTGWCLNVTNKSTKLVRDVSGFNTTGWLETETATQNKAERFAGTRSINASFGVTGENGYYRIYWAKDGNYVASGADVSDGTTPSSDFTTYYTQNGTFMPSNPTWKTELPTTDKANACYCLENTMDYEQQLEDRTTTVLLRTNYWTKFEGEPNASKKSFFICGTSDTKYPQEQVGESTGTHTDCFVEHLVTEANKILDTENEFSSYAVDYSELVVKTGENVSSGVYTNVEDLLTFSATGEKKTAQVAAVSAVVGGRISYYKNGENFYRTTLIRHFQDGEGVTVPESGIAAATDYELQHLGRYGVVRNNWYEIDITSISGPGDPEVDNPEPDPDDSAEGYINFTINVLSWAKRSQNVDL